MPWGAANPWQLVSRVLAGGRLEVPDREALPGPDTADFGGLDEYVALMKQCWAQDPSQRPTFQQIVVCLRCGWWVSGGSVGLESCTASVCAACCSLRRLFLATCACCCLRPHTALLPAAACAGPCSTWRHSQGWTPEPAFALVFHATLLERLSISICCCATQSHAALHQFCQWHLHHMLHWISAM